MKRSVAVIILLLTILLPVQGVQAAYGVLDEIKYYIESYYYGPIPPDLDTLTTIKEVESRLDGYSYYLNAADYRNYLATLGEVGDGLSLSGWASTVLPEVSSEYLFGRTGYIRISRFTANTPILAIKEWEALKKMGARHLILDFRNNGGGVVDSAVAMIGMFNDTPLAYTREERSGSYPVDSVPSKSKFGDDPYLLVNRGSASATELLAAAVKDQDAGVLVGQRTYGKGSIQGFFELSDGGAMKLTIAHFAGPGGTPIHGLGIEPDVVTPLGSEIQVAHEALIRRELDALGYTDAGNVEMPLPAQPFTVTFSQEMNLSAPAASNRMELVRMGNAKTVPVKLEQTGPATVRVTPQETLESGAVYVLAVNPRFADSDGIYMRKGAYLFIKTL